MTTTEAGTLVVSQDVQDRCLIKELLRIICEKDLKIGIHPTCAVGVRRELANVLLAGFDLSLGLVHLLLRAGDFVVNLS